MKYKMSEMTWQEFAAVKDNTIVFLPVGSTEQHGYHMTLAVDSIIAVGLAELAAKEVGGVVAPAINYGYKSAPFSGGGPLFPGTIDMQGATLQAVVHDVLSELVKDGVKKIFIVNAHYENQAFSLEAVDLVSGKYPDVKIVHVNWWELLSDDLMAKIFNEVPFPGWGFEHGGITETSLMLYFAPELVYMDRLEDQDMIELVPYAAYPILKGTVPESGVFLPNLHSSSQAKGKLMADAIVEAFKQIAHIELGQAAFSL